MSVPVMKNIDSERLRKNLTQEQLCEKLNINRGTYRNWMRTDKVPCSVIKECTKIFECSADYLLREF